MSGKFVLFHTSQDRIDAVIADIRAGSEPRMAFYSLLVTSSLIAGIGLVANSPAVIIGAMLVSPLMTPIFGIGLGMLRADGSLIRKAVVAEGVGVVLAIGVAWVVGVLLRGVEATPEMLARTDPHLLDLFVAVLAGFAGAFALVDERVSPALPGVAIATAIVPPLSNTGLCLALGANEGAFGSFMLFVANFFAILLVGLLTFAAAGMSPEFRWTQTGDVVRRFGVAAAGLLVVAVFLTPPLIQSIRDRRTEQTIDDVLTEALRRQPAAALETFVYEREGKVVEVLATVRSPEVMTPTAVSVLEGALAAGLGLETKLIVRTIVARDVAARGSQAQPVDRDLDGDVLSVAVTREQQIARTAEQVLYESLSHEPGFVLERVEVGQKAGSPLVLARIATARSLDPADIRELRAVIRERTGEAGADLVVQLDESRVVNSHETMLVEWTAMDELGEADEPAVLDLRRAVAEVLDAMPGLTCVETHLHVAGERWRVLAEIVGPEPPTPADVARAQVKVRERVGRPIELSVWFRSDAIITESGYSSFDRFTRETYRERLEGVPQMFDEHDADE